jgi:hypothetical protein
MRGCALYLWNVLITDAMIAGTLCLWNLPITDLLVNCSSGCRGSSDNITESAEAQPEYYKRISAMQNDVATAYQSILKLISII